jgi:hypothetical protein
MKVLRGCLIVVGVIGVLLFPPLLPLWLAGIGVWRRRRGESALPEFPFLTRPGRTVIVLVAWVGLLLVTITAFAASVSTSTDEHAAPVLGVFLIFGLTLLVAADLGVQVLLFALRRIRFGARKS